MSNNPLPFRPSLSSIDYFNDPAPTLLTDSPLHSASATNDFSYGSSSRGSYSSSSSEEQCASPVFGSRRASANAGHGAGDGVVVSEESELEESIINDLACLGWGTTSDIRKKLLTGACVLVRVRKKLTFTLAYVHKERVHLNACTRSYALTPVQLPAGGRDFEQGMIFYKLMV